MVDGRGEADEKGSRKHGQTDFGAAGVGTVYYKGEGPHDGNATGTEASFFCYTANAWILFRGQFESAVERAPQNRGGRHRASQLSADSAPTTPPVPAPVPIPYQY
jgi:hypothetical protein